MADTSQQDLLKKAYRSAFTELQLPIKQFGVEKFLLKLRQGGVINGRLQMRLVGESDPTKKGPIFYEYLIDMDDLTIYNNFIKSCDEIDSNLAKNIRTQLQIEIKRVALPPEFNPPAAQNTSSNMATEGEEIFQLQLNAYEKTFKDLQLAIELFHVGDNLYELKTGGIIKNEVHLRLVSEKDPTQKGKILYNYLVESKNIAMFNDFIAVCDKIDSKLANNIRERLLFHINANGLSDDYYLAPPAKNVPVSSSNVPLVTKPESASEIKNTAPIENFVRVPHTSHLQASQGQGKDIFISYQWDIQQTVRHLFDKLINKGYSCWIDETVMGGGDQLHAEMDRS